MPRFSQRIRKTRKNRKTRKQKKQTRRVKHRKQRGGIRNMDINNVQGLKEQLIYLITNHQDYPAIVDFIHAQIEMPIIHPNFPIEGNNGQYTMMIYGYPHDNESETTMLLIHIKKDENGFTEVDFDMMGGQVKSYLEQHGNPELMPMNEIHSAIEQATTETLVRA